MLTGPSIPQQQRVAIIGTGPAGLIAADQLSNRGFQVEMFDSMPTPARKFLIASKGGLNLTHSLPFPQFLEKYRQHQVNLTPFLTRFGPQQLIDWIQGLGIETFSGSSGRVFPKEMNGGNILHTLLERLKSRQVRFHYNWRLVNWQSDRTLTFVAEDQNQSATFEAVLFALGGASWPQLGSDGGWVQVFTRKDIKIEPLKPANCGFETIWSETFCASFAGAAVKPVTIHLIAVDGSSFQQAGEFIITSYGVEGSLIYAASAMIRDTIEAKGFAIIELDLAPQLSEQQIIERLSKKRGKRSLTTHLSKALGFNGVRSGLLYELLPKNVLNDVTLLAPAIKALPLKLSAPRPIEEAISSAGGVCFDNLDAQLMLKQYPGFFCAGEMLDWEAPTGGFLLTACFSTGFAAAQGIEDWLALKE